MIAKLKCEVINRRLKEKYEIELLEKEERNWEIKVVEVEYQLAIMQGDLSCERAEREELEVSLLILPHRIPELETHPFLCRVSSLHKTSVSVPSQLLEKSSLNHSINQKRRSTL